MVNVDGESFFDTGSSIAEVTELKAEEVFRHKYQTMVGIRKGEEVQLLKVEEELKANNSVLTISNVYPNLQEHRQFRVISHNDKLVVTDVERSKTGLPVNVCQIFDSLYIQTCITSR